MKAENENMPHRRDFLKEASILAGSLLGNSDLWAGANDRLRVALIGGGGRGRALIEEMLVTPGVEIAGVCDVDQNRLRQRASEVEQKTGRRPRMETDMRRLLEDPSIDAVTIATCDHWHALTTIWACQHGKHVYVEKPVCENVFEGQRMVEAARKYRRVVQGGTQRRSWGRFRRTHEILNSGLIGDVYMSRTLLTGYRAPIGFKPTEHPPSWLDWDLWLGPAPKQPYHANLVHYNWHWFWDFGNGEMGNNGSHYIDISRWFMKKELPTRIYSAGKRAGPADQGQTPNAHNATFIYEDGSILECEIRNTYTAEASEWHFYGTKGYLHFQENIMVRPRVFNVEVYLEGSKEPIPDIGTYDDIDHFGIFAQAVRENKPEMLTCDVEKARISATHCHLANLSYLLKRDLKFNPQTERFIGDDEANALLTREYRQPFVVPERV